MKRLLLSILLIFFFSAITSAQQFNWIHGGGTAQSSANLSNHPEKVEYSCTDFNGNVYALSVMGNYGIYADTFSRPSGAYGSDQNLFLSSYDCSGHMRWAKLIASSANGITPLGLQSDDLGHIYMAGHFTNATLHVGYDTAITGYVYNHEGIIQFDTAGHFNWIRYVGDSTVTTALGFFGNTSCLAIDSSNNAHFFVGCKFGVHLTPTIVSHWGVYDLKYNTSGSLLSVKKFQMDSTLASFVSCLDKKTNKVYLSGYRNTVLPGSYHAYVAAFDTARNQMWMDTMSSPGYEGSEGITGIAADGQGHLYYSVTGVGTVTLGSDTIAGPIPTGLPTVVYPYTSNIIKVDTSGAIKWNKKYRSGYNIPLLSVTLTGNNKIAAAGYYFGRNTCSGDTIISPLAGSNAYMTEVDTGGNMLYLKDIPGDGYYDYGWTITSDRKGNLYVGGAVADSIYASGVPAYHTVGGNTDFYVLRYGIDCDCAGMPVASFTFSGSPLVTFAYTGTTAGIDSVRWYFGDGGTATVFSPTHNYTAAGTYHVRINIYSHCGNDSYFATVVVPCVSTPASAFTSSGTSATRSFTFTGTPATPDSVAWTFGDGGHATGLTVNHTYAATGTFNVCATMYTACGNSTTCSSVSITCTAPLAAAYTHTGYTPVSFTYSGTTTGLDSVVWHYGDGGHGTGLTSAHTYATTGFKTACVLAYNHCGVDSACSTFNVPCITAPIASYTSSGITATRSFTYTGTAVGLDSVVWTFGDGGHAVGNTATHTYAATGTYNACVTAYSPCGSNTSCSSMTITCLAAPAAAFTTAGMPTTTFTYTGTTTGLDSVVWHYGDGSYGTGATAIHTYTLGGTYIACVLSYNHCGWDSACATIVVPCISPVAAFANSGTLVQNFTYTGTTPGVDSITWSYGDGNTGAGYTATHTYITEGTYHVCVMAYSYCAADTQCNDIVITCPPPAAAFTNNNDTFHYTGTTPTIDSIVWDFGDGFTDTGMSPVHSYAVTDTFNVCVRAYGYCGADTLCMNVIVTGVGISRISLSDINVYPNPTTDQVNITGITAPARYRLMSITGALLREGSLQIGTSKLNMNNYASGIYMIELLSTDGSKRTFRIIKE